VANELGLHARPASRLAQEAQKYAAEIRVGNGEEEVDAKSILDLLTLAVSRGSDLTLTARGSDARQAVERLVSLFESRFGEER
jgi:phosphocarrier protein